jgi:cytochrome c553
MGIVREGIGLRVLFALASLGFLGVVLAVYVLFSGIVTVAASSGHSAPVEWILTVGMKRSVEHHARAIEPPPLDEPALIHRGMRFFETDCVPCHGAPGVRRDDANDHLVPIPPELSKVVGEWRPRELFWIVKHGVKATGMPAWGLTHRDDEIWSAVAFMRVLAGMPPEQYRSMTRVPRAEREIGAIGLGRFVALAGPAVKHSATCARCHGLAGVGHATGAFPRIDGQDAAYLREALRKYASGERPSGVMGSLIRGLSEEELAAVVEHYAGAERHDTFETKGLDEVALQLGRSLAERGAPQQGVPPCADCHGADGVRGKPMVPYLAGQYADYTALQLSLWREGVRGGDGAAAPMAEIARRLDERQIDAAALYYSQLGNRPP